MFNVSSSKVSVMLTLSASAAENIGGVLAAIADLLRIAVPPSYEISRSPSPPMYSSPAEIYRYGFVSGVKRKHCSYSTSCNPLKAFIMHAHNLFIVAESRVPTFISGTISYRSQVSELYCYSHLL